MNIFQAIVLGLVQGLTEFIPVSSSGHLVIAHYALGVTESGLAFDLALHFGTLMALVVFFHKEILLLIKGIFGKNDYTHLAWWLIAATVPAVILGVLLEGVAESTFRSVKLVSLTMMGAAVFMLIAERFARRYNSPTDVKKVTGKQSIIIGLAQALALIPGVSRSGTTISTGLFVGLDRVSATRFAFLLGIPITAGAIAKVLVSEAAFHNIQHEPGVFFAGTVTAFLSGMFAIKFMLRFLAKHSLDIFAYYRIALGILVLALTM